MASIIVTELWDVTIFFEGLFCAMLGSLQAAFVDSYLTE